MFTIATESFIISIEVSHMTRHFSKSNMLRNNNPVKGIRGTTTSKRAKFTMTKSKTSPLSLILAETNLFETDN